jgi:hypothetical protein
MKFLLANGCSHTIGCELDPNNLQSCPEQTWPRWVAEHYGIDYKNIANGGAGNEQIARGTILKVSRLIEIDKVDPKDFMVCVLWSGYDRYEYWDQQKDRIRSFSPHNMKAPWQPEETVRKYAELRSIVEFEEYAHYKNLYYMFSLAKVLEGYGVEYHFGNSLNVFKPVEEFNASENLIKTYKGMLELYGDRIKNHLGFYDQRYAFRPYLLYVRKATPSPIGSGSHFGKEGQKQYSELFVKHIESNR